MLFRNLYGWRSEVCVKLSEDEAEEVVDREVLTYKINAIANTQLLVRYTIVLESQNTKPLKNLCTYETKL